MKSVIAFVALLALAQAADIPTPSCFTPCEQSVAKTACPSVAATDACGLQQCLCASANQQAVQNCVVGNGCVASLGTNLLSFSAQAVSQCSAALQTKCPSAGSSAAATPTGGSASSGGSSSAAATTGSGSGTAAAAPTGSATGSATGASAASTSSSSTGPAVPSGSGSGADRVIVGSSVLLAGLAALFAL